MARRDAARQLIAALAVALPLALVAIPAARAQLVLPSPSWNALTPQERSILEPLAPPVWDRLDAQRKQKWRGLAKRYPAMPPERQARVRNQMKTWATLTPEERREARSKYEAMKRLPPDKRAEMQRKWEEYRKLSPEDRAAIRGNPPGGARPHAGHAGRTARRRHAGAPAGQGAAAPATSAAAGARRTRALRIAGFHRPHYRRRPHHRHPRSFSPLPPPSPAPAARPAA